MHLEKKAAEEAHENNHEKDCCINYCHNKSRTKTDKINKQKNSQIYKQSEETKICLQEEVTISTLPLYPENAFYKINFQLYARYFDV